MKYSFEVLIIVVAFGIVGCSTRNPKPVNIVTPQRILSFGDPNPGGTNTCTNCTVPGIPPTNIDFGTNLCILPWSFKITNHIPVGGHFDNSYTFTISNLVSGSNYAVQFLNVPLSQGSNNWLTHTQFTASAVTKSWTEFVLEAQAVFFWRVVGI